MLCWLSMPSIWLKRIFALILIVHVKVIGFWTVFFNKSMGNYCFLLYTRWEEAVTYLFNSQNSRSRKALSYLSRNWLCFPWKRGEWVFCLMKEENKNMDCFRMWHCSQFIYSFPCESSIYASLPTGTWLAGPSWGGGGSLPPLTSGLDTSEQSFKNIHVVLGCFLSASRTACPTLALLLWPRFQNKKDMWNRATQNSAKS